MNDTQEYTLRWRGRQLGPYSLQELNRKLDEHEIGMGHEIQYQDKWITLEEFFAALNQGAAAAVRVIQSPQHTSQPGAQSVRPDSRMTANIKLAASGQPAVRITATSSPTNTPTPEAALAPPSHAPIAAVSSKRRLVYALLGVLFGFSGLHNYYARHWLTGLLQLLLSVATFLLGFGIIAPWLWALVETVVVRKDGKGLEMI